MYTQEWQGLTYTIYVCEYCTQEFYTQDKLQAHLTDVEIPRIESKERVEILTMNGSLNKES